MLKLECTLPNLQTYAYISLQMTNFLHFTVFTRKALVGKTFIKNSSNLCKSLVGIDATQLYTCSMCQYMQKRLYMRWEFNTDMQKVKTSHYRTSNFENMVMSFLPEKKTTRV